MAINENKIDSNDKENVKQDESAGLKSNTGHSKANSNNDNQISKLKAKAMINIEKSHAGKKPGKTSTQKASLNLIKEDKTQTENGKVSQKSYTVKNKSKRAQRCRNCTGCLAPKCGNCKMCLNPKMKKACLDRTCLTKTEAVNEKACSSKTSKNFPNNSQFSRNENTFVGKTRSQSRFFDLFREDNFKCKTRRQKRTFNAVMSEIATNEDNHSQMAKRKKSN